jgi:hypothetical protein
MQKKSFFIAAIIALSGCLSKKSSVSLPATPPSIKMVQDELKGNKYQAEKAGTYRTFKDDKEIEWIIPGKANEFEKNIADESTTLQLHFTNDTAVVVSTNNKTYNGIYSTDDKQGEDEEAGIRLRVSYIDEEFTFGDGSPTAATFTYLVEGIDDKSILLETPRSMNNRKIVVLMNKQ